MSNEDKALYGAFARLRSPQEVEAFLRDIATPGEVQALSERWEIARMLDEGVYSYRRISELTGASTTTIGRVARFLNNESNGGYRLALSRLNANEKKTFKA